MRVLFLFMICINLSLGQGLSDDFPFRVVYAENALANSTHSLGSLDYIKSSDVISVKAPGTLALIHESGFPIEFECDTTFIASDIHSLIEENESRGKNIVYGFRFPNPNIDLLFVATPDDLKRELNKMRWLPHQRHELEKFFPPTRLIDISNGLCFNWRSSKTSEYKILIRNFSGDEIASFNSITSAFKLDKATVDSVVKDSVALIQIFDSVNKKYSDEYLLWRLNTLLPFPYSCSFVKPSFALHVALPIEFSEQPDLDAAEGYYIMATKLSNRQFYKQMLLNFKKRWKRE